MKRVLIISTSDEEQKTIQEVNDQHSPGALQIETTASFAQDPNWWVTNNIDLLILNLPDDEELQSYFFKKLKSDVPKALPIIFLCGNISSGLMQVSTFFQKTRTMKSPVTAFHLYRSVIEVTTDYGDGKQQAHPRYMVDQTIYLSKPDQTTKMMAKMKNLSLSGAYIESTENPFPLSKGDKIKLTIPVDGGKEYSFDSRVMWVKKLEASRTGYGISFITDGMGGSETLENFFKGL